MTRDTIAFGPFTVLRRDRVLLEDGVRIQIGSRAFDTLLVLIDKRGDFVSNEELANAVWPGQIVSDVSLRVNLSSLRKALRDNRNDPQFIRNIPSRGYMFVGLVHGDDAQGSARRPVARRPIPIRTVTAIGREGLISAAAIELESRRLLTFVGAAGIGKTTVAIALANMVAEQFPDGVMLIDFATIGSADLIMNTVGAALQIEIAGNSLIDLASHLAGLQALIVFDNCEHLIDDVARFAELIVSNSPQAKIIATSREVLRLPSEFVVSIPPLEVPPSHDEMTAEEMTAYPAVALFVERASIIGARSSSWQDDLKLVSGICRQLEGVPLGIELAAARVQEFGLMGVASRLGDKLGFLTRGSRNAAPRHQTLNGAMDWSFSLLADDERAVLARLSVFAGSFSMGSAIKIARQASWSLSRTEDILGGLVLKSLLNFEIVHGVEHYRLLFMTRDYARVELATLGASNTAFALLAEDCLDLVQRAESEWNDGINERWRDLFGRRIDDLRNALDWALSRAGDVGLGIQIAARGSVMFSVLGLTDEFRIRIEQALDACRRNPGKYPVEEMRLLMSLGAIYAHTKGALADDDTMDAFADSYHAAVKLGDHAFAMQALSAQSATLISTGEYRKAIRIALEGFDAIPGGANHQVKFRTLAHSTHYTGDLDLCQRYLDAALAEGRAGIGVRYTGSQYDQRNVTLRSMQAKMLWLRGFADQGMKEALDCIEDASASGHVVSLCLCYGIAACVLAHATGGWEASQPLVADYLRTSRKNALSIHKEWAEAYEAFMGGSDVHDGRHVIERIGRLEPRRRNAMMIENCVTLGEQAVEPWQVDWALAGEGGWCKAEATRVKGEHVLRRDGDVAAARRLMEEALGIAQSQGARAFEIRAATSLARLLREGGDRPKARDILVASFEKFTEGFGTVDLVAAEALIRELS